MDDLKVRKGSYEFFKYLIFCHFFAIMQNNKQMWAIRLIQQYSIIFFIHYVLQIVYIL